MKKIPNLRHLVAFVAVVKHGSINKASENIFLSQPAITQALAKIEKQLKTALFERKTDGMSLTKEGEIFHFRVERALNILGQAVKRSYNLDKKTSSSQTASLFAITITQLTALVAVSEAQNYSAAGRNIGTSQSSLYRACKDLEQYLGTVLFEKTSLGVSPSKTAQNLSRDVKLAFNEINQGIADINANNNISSGSIIVGSLPLARTCILPQAINEFTEEYPDFNVSVIDGLYEDLLDHLRKGEIDVLVGALRFPVPSYDIHQETLFFTSNVILARKDHPLCKMKTPVTLDDLSQYGWVISRMNTPGRTMFEQIFASKEHPLPVQIIEASSQMLVREILIGSNKLTMLPKHQVHRELSEQLFDIVDYDSNQNKRAIGITIRKSWQGTTPQEAFISTIRKIGLSLTEI
ncbi:Bacterial regulatory helix-turn-helix protein [Vibrio sp. B1FLJ16]|uniref:LysR family transcriptional regulator n=1 Tax=Vibrio sp. B1FLJ16 TaxID=2751178 RepID=UPI0015F6DE51|nr:LysR family transcriptional regulator [Vibrio sp. B1FLJ16]CAD7818884.1 Bacterial regulatory helix-turn-helix protein [Vibrio sp. B1FLJ16]CAE6936502.1 Bacterial regulatory helix-turn-helix protein [Vibrio sp. B1FLJ16]